MAAGTRPSPWPFPLLQGAVLLSQCMALTHPLPTMAQPRASQQQSSPSSLGGWYKARLPVGSSGRQGHARGQPSPQVQVSRGRGGAQNEKGALLSLTPPPTSHLWLVERERPCAFVG
ncbi:hypothetical protein KIL84_015698 [Mauremys mutica]|uniref:Uncharacterized protein n=1 Tax=Mauremys mutica TaxID=74926 RepID=A0A9D3WT59_9SAUR|nr:hypothetical protein KIL84_015698 [Mauremys mutica]